MKRKHAQRRFQHHFISGGSIITLVELAWLCCTAVAVESKAIQPSRTNTLQPRRSHRGRAVAMRRQEHRDTLASLIRANNSALERDVVV